LSVEWFRSWHRAPTDSKWLVVAKRAGVEPGIVSAVFWALLDHASQHTKRGTVSNFDIESYSAWSGFTEEHITAVLRELEAKGIIVGGKLAEWDKRQPQRERDDEKTTSADRMRKLRAKKTTVAPGETSVTHVTPSDATVRQPEPPCATVRTDKDTDTDTDTEKKKKQEPRDARTIVTQEPPPKTFQQIVDIEFEETFWPKYPHKVGKPKARVSYFIARKRADLAAIMAGLDRYIADKPPERQWLNPTTFLNQDRFHDEPAPVAASRPEPAHNAGFRALAALASSPDDDDGRKAISRLRRDDDGGGPGGDSGGDGGAEIVPFVRPEA